MVPLSEVVDPQAWYPESLIANCPEPSATESIAAVLSVEPRWDSTALASVNTDAATNAKKAMKTRDRIRVCPCSPPRMRRFSTVWIRRVPPG